MRVEADKCVHAAHGAGRWFPGDARVLRAQVDACLAQADVPDRSARILAGIAPHAGYDYSGPVAGYTFRAVQAGIAAGHAVDTVVVLGFGHRTNFAGVALMDGDAIRTPLGPTRLDVDGARFLAAGSDHIRVAYGPHEGEHSAENEIPFVQVAAPDAELIVALLGDHAAATIEALVKGLVGLGRKKSLLVIASTDLLHDADHAKVAACDRQTLNMIANLDTAGLTASWRFDNQVCCGIGPVLTVLRYAATRGCTRGEILCYRNSGDDHPASRGSWVVGYGAVVFQAPENEAGQSPL
jgi:MEMO1 family protein